MLTLHQFESAFGVPNASPFCLKLECFLRMARVPYRAEPLRDLAEAPKRKGPFVTEEDGKRIGNSALIIAHLKRTRGIDLDAWLSPAERAAALALRVMLEEHLYFAILHNRWVEDAHWPLVRDAYLADLPAPVQDGIRAHVRGRVEAQGLGVHTPEEIYALAVPECERSPTGWVTSRSSWATGRPRSTARRSPSGQPADADRLQRAAPGRGAPPPQPRGLQSPDARALLPRVGGRPGGLTETLATLPRRPSFGWVTAGRFDPMTKVDCVLDIKATLGEGAMWDDRGQALWWVDIEAPALHRFDPASGQDRAWPMPSKIGCFAIRERGGLVVGLVDGFHFFDPETGAFQAVADPEPDKPGNRMNDGTTDPRGRFVAGTMPTGDRKPVAGFYRLNTDLSVDTLFTGLIVTNGSAFSPDGRIFYFSDSRPRCGPSGPATTTRTAAASPTGACSSTPTACRAGRTAESSTPTAATGWRASAAGSSSASRRGPRSTW